MIGAFRQERGEGRFGTLIGLIVLAITIYLGFKVVPVMVRSYEFRDYLEEQARFAALRKNEDEVKRRILKKADELELPIGAKNVKVRRSSSRFSINVKYTVPIETPVYTYDWVFDEAHSAPLF